jgi:hypothetical protein
MVDKHIAELRRQLRAASSVFGVVNRFNYYIRFMARNLGGRPSNGFGAAHIQSMITTLSRVQRALFAGGAGSGSILDHLKSMVHERFGTKDMPLGWFFVPNVLGGLGLHNPLVELLAIRQNIQADPAECLQKVLDREPDIFRRAQADWEASSSKKKGSWDMTFENYTEGRESASVEWGAVFMDLLQYPEPYDVVATSDVQAAIAVLRQWPGNAAFSQYINFGTLNYYDRWVMSLYCEELTAKFGTFAIVDPALIPVGMLEVFRGTKVRWEQ